MSASGWRSSARSHGSERSTSCAHHASGRTAIAPLASRIEGDAIAHHRSRTGLQRKSSPHVGSSILWGGPCPWERVAYTQTPRRDELQRLSHVRGTMAFQH
eukprot:5313496-Prymnesium_polylepis.1